MILLASVFYMGIVRAVCVFISQNARRRKGVLSEDIAAILLCTALYLHPKCSHALYVQYTRVSSCFFKAILQYFTVYFTWEKCVQYALTLQWNVRWDTSVLPYYIAAILPCTALYLHPKCRNIVSVDSVKGVRQTTGLCSIGQHFYMGWSWLPRYYCFV